MDGDNISTDELVALRRELAESNVLVDQHTKTINDLHFEKEAIERKKNDLEARVAGLEKDYEELLHKTIAQEESGTKAKNEQMVSDIKSKMEATHLAQKEAHQKEIDELKKELDLKSETRERISNAMVDLKAAIEELQVRWGAIGERRPFFIDIHHHHTQNRANYLSNHLHLLPMEN